MKSHPDAALRSTSEVVTQLPVPSRLGMLRFERLNEASWALLFLDPGCERPLGLPASDLCSLVGSPYASLMEPETRHQLHDVIQMQLAHDGQYQVQYRLHTPKGVQNLLEIGEQFHHHGRALLRGYLLPCDSQADVAYQQELESQVARLQASLELYQHSQEDHLQHLIRSRVQQSLIVKLARHRYGSDDPLLEAAQLITQAASEAYDVTSASLWNLTDDELQPVTLYDRLSDSHQVPEAIDIRGYPHYLQALNSARVIDAHDAQRDPRIAELAADYLVPRG